MAERGGIGLGEGTSRVVTVFADHMSAVTRPTEPAAKLCGPEHEEMPGSRVGCMRSPVCAGHECRDSAVALLVCCVRLPTEDAECGLSGDVASVALLRSVASPLCGGFMTGGAGS